MTSSQKLQELVAVLAAEPSPDAPTPEERATALQTVWEYGEEALPALLNVLESPYIAYLTRAFAFIGAHAVPALINALVDKSAQVRANAAFILGKLGDDAALSPLIHTLKDADPHVRKEAAVALSAFRDQRMVLPLIALLHDPSSEVRRAVAATLGLQGDTRAVEPLNDAFLHDADERVRRAAQEAIHRIGERAQQQRVEELSAEMRARMAEALHKTSQPPQDAEKLFHTFGIPRYELLLATLESDDHTVQRRAVRELIRMGQKAVEPLIRSAQGELLPHVRAHVAFALGELGDPRAIEVLEDMLDDAHEEVRYAAQKALQKLQAQ